MHFYELTAAANVLAKSLSNNVQREKYSYSFSFHNLG